MVPNFNKVEIAYLVHHDGFSSPVHLQCLDVNPTVAQLLKKRPKITIEIGGPIDAAHNLLQGNFLYGTTKARALSQLPVDWAKWQ